MAATPESFLELLEKSKLLSAEKLATARSIAQEIDSKDPRALAKTLVLKDLLTRWQAAHLLAGRSSFFMGKYKLIDQIGRGGMGGVFLVEHTMMNRTAALKVISRQLGKDPAALERFLTEARAIAALDHTNIAHAYDVDKEGERYYLVMEYIEGHDLQRMVEDEGPLDCEQAADYIRQAAEGLAHAHGRNMIHCDIKPANLLVNRQGVVKILDMGMARLVGRGQNGSDSNERLLGTVDYMAPEQALDSPNLDHRVDIYSLGCTLYYLLTGKAPFPEGSIHERLLKHQTKEPRAISELRPEVPKDLVEICRKMMAKEPTDRYQSAEELSQVLGDWRPPPTQKLKRAVPLEAAEAAVVEPDEDEEETPSERPRAKGAKKAFRQSPVALDKLKDVLEKIKPLLAVEKLKPLLADRRKAALAGGIGLAVLVLLGVLVWAFSGKSRPSDEAVAAQTEKTAETDRKADKKKTSKETAEATAGEKKEKKETETTAAEKKPAAEPEAKTAAPDKAAKTESAAEKAAGDKDAKSAKDAPKSSDKSAGKAAEKTADKAAAKPAEKPADKTAEKPKTEKKPDKAEEKAKPEAAPKPKETPKPANPFAGFPAAVDLTAEPVELGKINTPDKVAWELDLENGDKVLKGNRHFTKPEAKEEDGKPTWIVQLSAPGVGKDKEATLTDIAKFSRDGQSLRFEWAEGVPASLAGNLRLCTLKIRAGGTEHSAALLSPYSAESLPLNLDRPVVATKVAVPWLPETSRIHVQIVKLEGIKDYTITPQDPVPLRKKIVISLLQKDPRTKAEQAGLEFTCMPTATAKMLTFSVQVPKNLFSVPLKTLQQDPSLVVEFRKAFPPNITRDPPLVELFKFAATEPNFRIWLGQQLRTWNASLEKPGGKDQNKTEMKAEVAERLAWLIDLEALAKSAKIHFRVLAEVGDQQVEVATSGAVPETKK